MSEQQAIPCVTFQVDDLRRVYCIIRVMMACYGDKWSVSAITTAAAAASSLAVFAEMIEQAGAAAGVAPNGKIAFPSETFADVLDAIRRSTFQDSSHPMAVSMASMSAETRATGRRFVEQMGA